MLFFHRFKLFILVIRFVILEIYVVGLTIVLMLDCLDNIYAINNCWLKLIRLPIMIELKWLAQKTHSYRSLENTYPEVFRIKFFAFNIKWTKWS